MQKHSLRHADQVYALLAVVLALIDPLDRESVAARDRRLFERNPMSAPVGISLGRIPFETARHGGHTDFQ
jgi:hypothetical protein